MSKIFKWAERLPEEKDLDVTERLFWVAKIDGTERYFCKDSSGKIIQWIELFKKTSRE